MDDSHQQVKTRAFKVIIVGPQAVGKSSILYRLSQFKFNTAYLSTVGIDFKTYAVRVEEKLYSLQIWDTAGQQKFRALTSTYYKGSQACVIVFDISDASSLQKCDYYINKAFEQNIPKTCIYLIGNKTDVPHSEENGKQIAQKYQINYAECSAKEGTKVAEIFDQLCGKLVEHFGSGREEGEKLKPQVNIKVGSGKCCKG